MRILKSDYQNQNQTFGANLIAPNAQSFLNILARTDSPLSARKAKVLAIIKETRPNDNIEIQANFIKGKMHYSAIHEPSGCVIIESPAKTPLDFIIKLSKEFKELDKFLSSVERLREGQSNFKIKADNSFWASLLKNGCYLKNRAKIKNVEEIFEKVETPISVEILKHPLCKKYSARNADSQERIMSTSSSTEASFLLTLAKKVTK